MEEEALAYFDTIDRMGGMVAAIEQGFPQKEMPKAPTLPAGRRAR